LFLEENMEKSIAFSPIETALFQQMEQERTNALAQIGALMMDLETAKKNLEMANERRNTFVKQIIAGNGINQFESVRPSREGLVVSIPEPMIRPNGAENASELSTGSVAIQR
jgi:hypothetical protein